MRVRLDELIIHPRVFPRLSIDDGRVAEMAQLYAEAGPLALPPPEIVTCNDDTKVIGDGVTRVTAARAAGFEELEVIVLEVPDGRDPIDVAHLRALETAATAAKPLTRHERQRAVRALLDRHPDWPDREIARRVGISHQTVGRLRGHGSELGPAKPEIADEYLVAVSAVRVSDQLARGLARAWEARGITDLLLGRMPGTLAASLERTFGEDAVAWARRLEGWAAEARKQLEQR